MKRYPTTPLPIKLPAVIVLAEGRRGQELACTERAGILCGRHGRELAIAVEVVTHAQGVALARSEFAESYPLMPEGYRSAECADGEAFDLRPDDSAFPS
jgi:hypothetical protein